MIRKMRVVGGAGALLKRARGERSRNLAKDAPSLFLLLHRNTKRGEAVSSYCATGIKF